MKKRTGQIQVQIAPTADKKEKNIVYPFGGFPRFMKLLYMAYKAGARKVYVFFDELKK